MGTRFRKSVKLPGGSRINLSKSGVGGSLGGKGFRITKTATGSTRTTVSAPGTGLSHVSETSGGAGNGKRGQGLYGFVLSSALIVIMICSMVLLFASCADGSGNQDDTPPPTQSTPAGEIVAVSELKQTGQEYLTGLGYDVVEAKETDRWVEFAITLPALSGLDQDVPPDDWEDTRADVLASALGMSEAIGDNEKSIVIKLQDDSGTNLLSLVDGVENYNLFAVKEESSSSADDTTIVWISDNGSRYHLDPDCSGMRDPRPVRKSYALEKGYIACSRCAK